MKELADLLKNKESKNVSKKRAISFKVSSEVAEKVLAIARRTGYTKPKVAMKLFMAGLKAYEDLKDGKQAGKCEPNAGDEGAQGLN